MTPQKSGQPGITYASDALDKAEALHPRDWALAQTALTGAVRDALFVVVSAYTGFQLRNGEFYIVESRIAPYLRTSFPTFKNYITKLRKLGLMELLSRSPNQWGERSMWRMRLHVVLSNGQMMMPLHVSEKEAIPSDVEPEPEVVVSEDVAAEAAVQVDSDEEKAAFEREVRGYSVKELEQAELAELALIREMEQEVDGLIERLTRAVGKVGSLRAAQRAELERGAGKKNRRARVAPVSEAKAIETVKLVGDVNWYLEKWGEQRLTGVESRRAGRIEADWRAGNGGADVPAALLEYAAGEAMRFAEKSRSGYMLRVLEDKVREGYVEPERGTSGYTDGSTTRGSRKSRY